jgi:hypothetical protein
MTTEQATLIAAGVAAVASLSNVASTARGALKAELRVARRKSLEASVVDLGECLHQVLACANVLMMTSSAEATDSWRSRAQEAKKRLKDLRPKVRYSLWGMDEALRVLSRIPDWSGHLRSNPHRAKKLLRLSNRLRAGVDRSVRTVYVNGDATSLLQRAWVMFYAWRCRAAFGDKSDE